MRKILIAALALTAALSLNACSSSGGNHQGGGSSSPGGTEPSTGGSGSSGVAAAKAYEATFLDSPTTINIDTPLSKRPATDKTLIGLDSGLGSAKVLAQYWKQATEDLGWKYIDMNSGTTPEQQQKAMESAIQQNPSGILTSGIPISTIKSQLADLQSAWREAARLPGPLSVFRALESREAERLLRRARGAEDPLAVLQQGGQGGFGTTFAAWRAARRWRAAGAG